MDTNLDLYITQEIPNMKGIFSDVEQKVAITSIKIDWQSFTSTIIDLPQIIVKYEIIKTQNGENLSSDLRNKIKPKVFNNKTKLSKRSFEESSLFEPIPNPKFISKEDTPEETEFEEIGAFDFIIGELVMKRIDLLIPFLKLYILDNYNDGWFDSSI